MCAGGLIHLGDKYALFTTIPSMMQNMCLVNFWFYWNIFISSATTQPRTQIIFQPLGIFQICIPHICHFCMWYTITLYRSVKKMRKKIASRQISVRLLCALVGVLVCILEFFGIGMVVLYLYLWPMYLVFSSPKNSGFCFYKLWINFGKGRPLSGSLC